MVIAARDPELGAVFDGLMEQFLALGEEAVAQVQPAGVPPDEDLIKEQALAVITYPVASSFDWPTGCPVRAGLQLLRDALRLEAERPRPHRRTADGHLAGSRDVSVVCRPL